MRQIDEILHKYGLKRLQEYDLNEIIEDYEWIKRKVETGEYTEKDMKIHLLEMAFGRGYGNKTIIFDKTQLGVSAGNVVKDFPLDVESTSILTRIVIDGDVQLGFEFARRELEPLVIKKLQEARKNRIENKELLLKILFDEEKTVKQLVKQLEEVLKREKKQLGGAPLSGKLLDELYEVMKLKYEYYSSVVEEGEFKKQAQHIDELTK